MKVLHILAFFTTVLLEIGSLYAAWGKHLQGVAIIVPLFLFTLGLILQGLFVFSCVWQMTRNYEETSELALYAILLVLFAFPLLLMFRQYWGHQGAPQQFLLDFLLAK